jgi:hypothetical protein
VHSGDYVGLLEAQGAGRWSAGAWQTIGRIDAAHLRWAEDIVAASRWSLEQERIVPGS